MLKRDRPRLCARLFLLVASWFSNRLGIIRANQLSRRVHRANRQLRRRITAMAEQRTRLREEHARLTEVVAEGREELDRVKSRLGLAAQEVVYLAAFQKRAIEHQMAEAAIHVARRTRADTIIESSKDSGE